MHPNLLKILRGNKSQALMAQEYNVSQQCWQSWENGRTVPNNATMLKMERSFGVPMEVIFFFELQFYVNTVNLRTGFNPAAPAGGSLKSC